MLDDAVAQSIFGWNIHLFCTRLSVADRRWDRADEFKIYTCKWSQFQSTISVLPVTGEQVWVHHHLHTRYTYSYGSSSQFRFLFFILSTFRRRILLHTEVNILRDRLKVAIQRRAVPSSRCLFSLQFESSIQASEAVIVKSRSSSEHGKRAQRAAFYYIVLKHIVDAENAQREWKKERKKIG